MQYVLSWRMGKGTREGANSGCLLIACNLGWNTGLQCLDHQQEQGPIRMGHMRVVKRNIKLQSSTSEAETVGEKRQLVPAS
mmetsp:Transcript_22596/g.62733  ORF Transcript_22596/g.62733 Transcript_22596/m.62733 type:complete len:81 (+) Transcript_22596:277-519(+)